MDYLVSFYQSQLLWSALSSAGYFKSHSCEQCGPRMVHTVCRYAKIGLKSLQEYSADHINRRHFQMQVLLGVLRVNEERCHKYAKYISCMLIYLDL